SGTPFKTVELFFTNKKGVLLYKLTYKLVAVKTVSWSADAEHNTKEAITFEYGGLVVSVFHAGADGQIHLVQNGWNRVKNTMDNQPDLVIA
ncbi:MAG: hypothetical protein M3015_06130, partial [Bacteroidota bacterium]|nr:hypothetical protein [Bacteroidota bacterium]